MAVHAERMGIDIAAAAVPQLGVLDAIRVSEVSKTFRLPHERHTTVRERVRHVFSRTEYEAFEALHDVSLDVKRGELFGIVGRNGSGKSTLLRCVAGIYVPDAGAIAVEGRLASFIDLGVGFNPELPARDNAVQSAVLFGLDPREAEARFEEMLEFAELERFEDLRLKNYSSGMSARLAFAVTVHVDADVLLFDEVLAVGDAGFRHKCLEHFDRLRASGKTIVLVTHDTKTVASSCDRALLLHEGRALELGSPEAIVDRYEAIAAEAAARRPPPRAARIAPTPRRRGALAGLFDALRETRAYGIASRLLRTSLRPVGTASHYLIAPSLGRSSMVGPDVSRFLVLTRMLARTDFRVKYAGTAFNYVWAVAHPAALFGILLLVFGALGRFNRGIENYAAYLMLAIVMWTFFAQATSASVACLKRRGSLLRKLPLPRLTVPFAAILGATFDLAVNLVVVLAYGLATGVRPHVSWLELPLLVAGVALFATGVGVLLSALYVRHRDLGEVWTVTSRVLFYGTPIFYVATMLPGGVREAVVLFNPLATVFTEARHAFIDPSAPSAAAVLGGYEMLLVPFGMALGLLCVGLWVFARESPRVAEFV